MKQTPDKSKQSKTLRETYEGRRYSDPETVKARKAWITWHREVLATYGPLQSQMFGRRMEVKD